MKKLLIIGIIIVIVGVITLLVINNISVMDKGQKITDKVINNREISYLSSLNKPVECQRETVKAEDLQNSNVLKSKIMVLGNKLREETVILGSDGNESVIGNVVIGEKVTTLTNVDGVDEWLERTDDDAYNKTISNLNFSTTYEMTCKESNFTEEIFVVK